MMTISQKTKGWRLGLFALFLGPFFLIHHFHENHKNYPAARYLAWSSFPLLALCTWLMISFTFSPFIVRAIYCVLFLTILVLTLLYCWVVNSKTEDTPTPPWQTYSISRAVAWMTVMGILFQGCNNLAQAFYFWVFGEQVSVYYSDQANVFKFWCVIGLIYGFFYGLVKKNDTEQKLLSFVKSMVFILFFVFLFNGLILLLGIYPLQRLAPISYRPQTADFVFYFLFFMAISLSVIHLMKTVHGSGYIKTALRFFSGIMLIICHAIVVSAYTTTINLTIASILEDRGKLSSAKTIYSKSIPFIRHDQLLASLHHRQGVLHVLNKDYDAAMAGFKRVIADYSENYNVYKNARKYVDSYEKNQNKKHAARKILPVRHKTFEQAASCFPNSLSVILNFYENEPVSTRKLSYAIKEGFSSGTFIWKAESFLSENNYKLITTFWQDKEALISLINAGYPVLLYVPGHVYTLYGYDALTEMFFTYDTARSNRWNDKPFDKLLRNWMQNSFLMSVVVPMAKLENFNTLFPNLFNHSHAFEIWQKTQISNYYSYKNNYWKDYNPYKISETLGFDRLIIGDRNFFSKDFYPFPWESDKWKNEILPVLKNNWALDWPVIQKFILYLIKNEKPELALDLIRQYQSHLSEERQNTFSRLLKLKLSAALAAGNKKEVAEISEKLIALSNARKSDSSWGHYLKAKRLMASGNFKTAAELLLPTLNSLNLRYKYHDPALKNIVNALLEIHQSDPSLIDPEKKAVIDLVRVYFAGL